jgi:serine/threonine protein kinase/formylglycine-generating enzyme required for sulfatase activity
MTRDELQGRRLLAYGWATQDLVNKAWHTPRQPHQDILDVLMAWGHINNEQAQTIRREVEKQSHSSAGSQGSSHSTNNGPLNHPGYSSTGHGMQSTASGPGGLRAPAAQRDWSLGVGPYQILNEISRGGMGIVFRAKHSQSGEMAALKVMLAEEATETDKKRFEREAKALGRFSHPNIVRILGSGIDPRGNEPYFAMELIDGTELKDVIDNHRKAHNTMPDLPWMLGILKPLASALAACHAQKIVHRDLKPQNILVENTSQRPVIVDFGLVKKEKGAAADEESVEHNLTKQGDVLGTPAYMAPEQLDPEEFGGINEFTDVWGFGGILLYCLTGREPYQGSTNFNIYKKVMTERPPRASRINKDVPPWLDDLCESCFQRDKNERPTMASIVEQLEQDPENHTHTKSGSGLLIGATIGLLLALSAAFAISLGSKGTPALELKSPTTKQWVNTDHIEIVAQTSPQTNVFIKRKEGGQWLKDAAQNTVKISASIHRFSPQLKAGLNVFRIEVDGGTKESSKEVTVHCDQQAPTLRFLRVSALWKTIVFTTEKGELTGLAKDNEQLTVLVNGSVAKVNQSGRFVFVVKNKSMKNVTVIARDKAGNECKLTAQLKGPKEKQAFQALCDSKKWNQSPVSIQDIAIQEVQDRLGPQFKKFAVARYKAGGKSHRIASFGHPPSGLIFNLIPGGSFYMGVEDEEKELKYCREVMTKIRTDFGPRADKLPLLKTKFDEKSFQVERPYHRVGLKPFLIGRYLVSKEQWDRGEVLHRYPNPPNNPIVSVTFPEVKKWLKKWPEFRLPSESEWEYSCRAGTQTRYFWGDLYKGQYCWSWRNNGILKNRRPPWTQKINAHINAPNPFGLIDILGHVWEMCEDEYFNNYKGAPNDGSARQPAKGRPRKYFVRRGGGALYGGAVYALSYKRGTDVLTTRSNSIGFRVALNLPGINSKKNN